MVDDDRMITREEFESWLPKGEPPPPSSWLDRLPAGTVIIATRHPPGWRARFQFYRGRIRVWWSERRGRDPFQVKPDTPRLPGWAPMAWGDLPRRDLDDVPDEQP